MHGIALAVRAGASGRVYLWAVSAVAAIGVGAFAVSFLALRDLMRAIGYGDTTAWIFPAIIDTAVAVSTLMLVALGDKPARRTRTVTTPPIHKLQWSSGWRSRRRRLQTPRSHRLRLQIRGRRRYNARVQNSASVNPFRRRPCRTQRTPRRHRSMQKLRPI